MSRTHIAIATTSKGVLDIVSLTTPEPRGDEVLIRVVYSSLVALDTYIADSAYHVSQFPLPLGLNAAGRVVKVGMNVNGFKVGDRVVTFSPADEVKGKATQQYAVLSKFNLCKIPDSLSFQDAVTIPDNFVTAYFSLFDSLRLPIPTSLPATSSPPEKDTPILIYGSGTTAGQYLIQVLRLAGYTRILTTASAKHHDHLRSLGATDVFDYSDDDLSDKILEANNKKPIKYAVDCVTAESSLKQVSKVVGKGSVVSLLLPIKEGTSVTAAPGQRMWMEVPQDRNPFVEGVELVGTKTFTYQKNSIMKETLMPIILPHLLSGGHIQPSRVRLFEFGLFKERVEEALDLLRQNKISGEKVVVQIP
ncbi:GroES-like protein [Ramaria rubella]|nr:GroES-like protein [Ramaria rubella]